MRVAVSCLLLAAAGPVISVATSATAAAKGRAAYRRAPDFDVSGLGDALKSGGAEGLLKALGSLQANKKNNDANMNIVRDAKGRAMYNFVVAATDPPTTKPATTTLALPVVPASTDDSGDDDDEGTQAAPAAKPVPAAAASAAAAPGAAAAAVPPALALPAAAGGSLAALASGLDAVRQQVDALSAQADAAMRGAPMPAAGALVAVPSAQADAALQAQTDAALQGVLKRMQALEDENKKLRDQVASQSRRLDKMETSQKADEQDINKEKAENEGLVKALQERRKHHHDAQKHHAAKSGK